ncbi:MAG: DUF4123 domain-containing protein, partial [Ilumatobacter sp.]
RSWFILTQGQQDLPALRGHLRRLWVVRLPEGRLVEFRFYVPRGLRVSLRTCSAAEAPQAARSDAAATTARRRLKTLRDAR